MFGSCVNIFLVIKDISWLVKMINFEVFEVVLCVDMLLINKLKLLNVLFFVIYKFKVE